MESLGISLILSLTKLLIWVLLVFYFNIFKIRKKINETVKEVIRFNPDILFSVDSPDFTLRVAEKVKKINKNIKTIHLCVTSSLDMA